MLTRALRRVNDINGAAVSRIKLSNVPSRSLYGIHNSHSTLSEKSATIDIRPRLPNNAYSYRSFSLWGAFKTGVELVSSGVTSVTQGVWNLIKSVADYAFRTVPTDEPPTHSTKATNDSYEAAATASYDAPKKTYPEPTFKGWSTKNINVAIIGDAGNGKSSFINAYLNKSPTDSDRAETGFVETTGIGNNTVRCFKYEVSENRHVLFWDLPGCGTTTYPFDEYIQTMGLRHFDSCILVTATRFTEHDDRVALQLHEFDVPTYLIRSKFDQDLLNHCHDKDIQYEALETKQQDKIVEDMRETLHAEVNRAFRPETRNIVNNRFFILSSRNMALTIDDWMALQEMMLFELYEHRKADKSLKDTLKVKWRKAIDYFNEGRRIAKEAADKARKKTKDVFQKVSHKTDD